MHLSFIPHSLFKRSKYDYVNHIFYPWFEGLFILLQKKIELSKLVLDKVASQFFPVSFKFKIYAAVKFLLQFHVKNCPPRKN